MRLRQNSKMREDLPEFAGGPSTELVGQLKRRHARIPLLCKGVHVFGQHLKASDNPVLISDKPWRLLLIQFALSGKLLHSTA